MESKVDRPDGAWSATHQQDDRLFVGSAVKTFILTKYLQDVEEGLLSEDDQLAIDDSVPSPVFLNLTGSPLGIKTDPIHHTAGLYT
jgi:beta-lactamase class A